MPCNSDYMRQSGEEAAFQKTAQCYAYALARLGRAIPANVQRAAKDMYTKADFVANLCALLKEMSPGERERITYNSHSKESRALADWWEEHQEADREREAQESNTVKRRAARLSALAKLTPEEMAALGLEDR